MTGQADGGTAPSGAPLELSARVFRLQVAWAPRAEAIGTLRLVRAPMIVGREGSGLTLEDATASREHAELAPMGDHLIVRDLASRNGVFVAGRKIERAEVRHGDPIRVGDHLFVIQELSALDVERLVEPVERGSRLLGDGPAMRALDHAIGAAAPGSLAALVLGPSGAGKELVASELHRRSGRTGAFVPVNCAAIPEELAESELFGHVKGAFSGALSASDGLFGAADGGTLFLDEIGETSATTQARLLRALADGEVRRVGETAAKKRDVRIVAATNVDLRSAVEAGRFRGDLLARLEAHVIRVPSLRERREDVLPLATAYLDHASPTSLPSSERVAESFTPDAAEALLAHPFPWNVRELAQRMRALSGHPRPIPASALPAEWVGIFGDRARAPTAGSIPAILEVRPNAVPSADELRAVLAHFGGRVSRVATFFGKERRQIYRWAERLGVEIDATRDAD